MIQKIHCTSIYSKNQQNDINDVNVYFSGLDKFVRFPVFLKHRDSFVTF